MRRYLWIYALSLLSAFAIGGESLLCYVGNSTSHDPNDVMDCATIGRAREELYCRNITSPDGSVHRNCVAMSSFGSSFEELGCQTSTQEGFVRCTCNADYCNVPWSYTSNVSFQIKGSPLLGLFLSIVLYSFI